MDAFRRNISLQSMGPILPRPMMATRMPSSSRPKGFHIVRAFSNNASKQTPQSSAEPLSVFQSIYNETQALLKELYEFVFIKLPILIPRFVAFGGTLHLTSQYGFNSVSCDGPSMEPTIIDGSYTCILIEQWSHRLFGLEKDIDHVDENEKETTIKEDGHSNHPEENENSWDIWYALLSGIWKQHFASGLQHGDVIILNHPLKNSTVCKRIIGMPGDTIVRTDGVDKQSSHRTVPPGHLWIEGDNTNNSTDSRSYGMVPASLVIGKVVCRLWPLREYASLGLDANDIEHWRRVDARIGRCRPLTDNGSYLLDNEKGDKDR